MRKYIGLYRGKRIDNGEWVEGSLLKVTLGDKAAYLIFGDNFSYVGNDVKALSHASVDPVTVGECTGLKDKNGKLIFEGDIVRITDRYLKAVNWIVEHRNYGFSVKHLLCEYWWSVGELDGYTVEVIGSIHDNPELLEN